MEPYPQEEVSILSLYNQLGPPEVDPYPSPLSQRLCSIREAASFQRPVTVLGENEGGRGTSLSEETLRKAFRVLEAPTKEDKKEGSGLAPSTLKSLSNRKILHFADRVGHHDTHLLVGNRTIPLGLFHLFYFWRHVLKNRVPVLPE